VSIERMCAGREFQVEGADTEKAREEKLLVIPAGLVRRFVGVGIMFPDCPSVCVCVRACVGPNTAPYTITNIFSQLQCIRSITKITHKLQLPAIFYIIDVKTFLRFFLFWSRFFTFFNVFLFSKRLFF